MSTKSVDVSIPVDIEKRRRAVHVAYCAFLNAVREAARGEKVPVVFLTESGPRQVDTYFSFRLATELVWLPKQKRIGIGITS